MARQYRPGIDGPVLDPDTILEQEEAGRFELIAGTYKVGFTPLPTKMRPGQEAFEALGFEFGDVVEKDPLFRLAKLPEGWRLEPEEDTYSYWSLVIDTAGETRARVFYKAAFYDRKAEMRVEGE